MAIVNVPDRDEVIRGAVSIKKFLNERGIHFSRWEPSAPLSKEAGQEEVLAAYESHLQPFMTSGGYQTADVISIFPHTEGLPAIRQKFLREHTHSEDEVRFFIEGEGLFWFNLGGGEPVFSVLCQAGDFISVPAETKHWFDLGPQPMVRAIRVFIDPSGWVPHYTDSGIDEKYNPVYTSQ